MTLGTLADGLFTLTTGSVVIAVVAAVVRTAAPPAARWRDGLIAVAVICAWLGLTAGLALAGALDDFTAFPPPLVPLVLIGNIAVLVVVCSPLGGRLARGTPVRWLVGVQVFRVGVEACLALLFHTGVVPVQMTFEGRNWDILVGLSALPVAWLVARGGLGRGWLLAWTAGGLGLLLNIVAISVLSLPTAFRAFPDGPANTFIATAPYIWLPSVLVPIAFGAHLLLLRTLLGRRAHGDVGPSTGGAPKRSVV